MAARTIHFSVCTLTRELLQTISEYFFFLQVLELSRATTLHHLCLLCFKNNRLNCSCCCVMVHAASDRLYEATLYSMSVFKKHENGCCCCSAYDDV